MGLSALRATTVGPFGDMGTKTVGNALDNAWIRFKGVLLPKSALMSRYSDVIDDHYVSKQPGTSPIRALTDESVSSPAVRFARSFVR